MSVYHTPPTIANVDKVLRAIKDFLGKMVHNISATIPNIESLLVIF